VIVLVADKGGRGADDPIDAGVDAVYGDKPVLRVPDVLAIL